VLHVGLAFLSGYLTHAFDVHLGYTFSASAIDFVLGFFNQKNSWALWVVIGPVIAALYFTSFYGLIGLFNFKTPGRDVEKSTGNADTAPISKTGRAAKVLSALGGSSNIVHLDACITRLRLTVRDPKIVIIDDLKGLGAAGVMSSGPNLQVIFGVESDLLKGEIKSLMTNNGLASPIDGEILELSQVPDETFSQKILGDGFAVNPKSGLVKAPCDGVVEHVFPTSHALIMKNNDGLEILIHVGIDTVNMKGEGFNSLVKAGDLVKKGDRLIEFNLELVKQKAKSAISPVVITNMEKVASVNLERKPKADTVLNVEFR
jgi:glucose-specific phosphotransferase system IIA component